jgi:hypothetical protein
MSKKVYVFILGLMIIVSLATYSYLKHQEFLAQRHHLLCEILKPEMSKEEVLRVLSQAGVFTTNHAEWLGGYVELGVAFTDPKGREMYGAFDLLFIDDKYVRAYVRLTSDSAELICDFYQPTKSATETPTPVP